MAGELMGMGVYATKWENVNSDRRIIMETR